MKWLKNNWTQRTLQMGRFDFHPQNPQQDARNTARLLIAKQWWLLNRLAQIELLLGYYSISNQKCRNFTMNIYLSVFSPRRFWQKCCLSYG